MVVCEDKTDHAYYTESPMLVVEVLSKSTRRNDETIKRLAYQALPSVMEYVLIEQDFVDIEVCRRSSGWVPNHYFLGDEVWLESIDLSSRGRDLSLGWKWRHDDFFTRDAQEEK